MTPRVAIAVATDRAAWLELRAALWPGDDAAHQRAIAAQLATPQPERLALLASVDGDTVGLAEAAIRHDYVNGCNSSPVLFLEGLFVSPEWRRRGIARDLVERVAVWGAAARCEEFASDADIGNEDSRQLHGALGFHETERVVFFRRPLAS